MAFPRRVAFTLNASGTSSSRIDVKGNILDVNIRLIINQTPLCQPVTSNV